jgi:hypothetical protein
VIVAVVCWNPVPSQLAQVVEPLPPQPEHETRPLVQWWQAWRPLPQLQGLLPRPLQLQQVFQTVSYSVHSRLSAVFWRRTATCSDCCPRPPQTEHEIAAVPWHREQFTSPEPLQAKQVVFPDPLQLVQLTLPAPRQGSQW